MDPHVPREVETFSRLLKPYRSEVARIGHSLRDAAFG